MPRRKALIIAFALATGWYAWGQLAQRVEVVTLFVSGIGVQDHYTRLWVVDDPPYVWLRAERPDRVWVDSLRTHPNVTMWRGEAKLFYRAEILDNASPYVDELFALKYGLLDQARGLIGRQSVAIRLEGR